jgi:hypothetical protein
MMTRAGVRALAAWLSLACSAGCRDEALVGEGSACTEECSAHERCTNGACVPVNDGGAGDDSDRFDENDRDHDDHGGPGGGPGGGRSDDGVPEP